MPQPLDVGGLLGESNIQMNVLACRELFSQLFFPLSG